MDDLFSFEKLDIYQRALSFAHKIQSLISEVKGHYSLCDQLNRAATSVVLNIAEGSGRWHDKDKRNFYFIARGSAFECVPLVDLGLALKILSGQQRGELRSDLKAVCQMLTKLIQSVENETKNEKR